MVLLTCIDGLKQLAEQYWYNKYQLSELRKDKENTYATRTLRPFTDEGY